MGATATSPGRVSSSGPMATLVGTASGGTNGTGKSVGYAGLGDLLEPVADQAPAALTEPLTADLAAAPSRPT